MKEEIYVSTDIETDGPIPGKYSMLSIGSAAFNRRGELLETFERNIFPLPMLWTEKHPDTMAWWKTQPEAWAALQENRVTPSMAMVSYFSWLKALPGKPVFVGYPAGFDFTFVYWYLMFYMGESPFGFQALDIKTLAMARLGTTFKETSKRNMPSEWFGDRPHTHKALDDAIEQGELFFKILADTKRPMR